MVAVFTAFSSVAFNASFFSSLFFCVLFINSNGRPIYTLSVVILVNSHEEYSEKFAEIANQMFCKSTFTWDNGMDNVAFRCWIENATSLGKSNGGVSEALASMRDLSTNIDGAIFVDVTPKMLALSSLMENLNISTFGLFQSDEVSRTQENRAELTRITFPSIQHYASSMWKFMKKHEWRTISLIASADFEGKVFAEGISSYAHQERWKIDKTVWLQDKMIGNNTKMDLHDVIKQNSDVVVVHGRQLSSNGFFEAIQDLGFDKGQSIWIMTDITTSGKSNSDLPKGLLKISIKKPRMKHDYRLYMDVLSDALLLFQESFQLGIKSLCNGRDLSQCLSRGVDSNAIRRAAKRHLVGQTFKGKTAFFEIPSTEKLHQTFEVWNLQRGADWSNEWLRTGLGTAGGVALDNYIAPNRTIIKPNREMSKPIVSVAVNEYPPFVYKREPSKGNECTGRSVPCYKYILVNRSSYTNRTKFCCAGASIDFLFFLQNDLNFQADVYLSPDEQHGIFDDTTNTWNGIVNEMLSGRAKLSLEMGLSESRAEVLDFAHPTEPLTLGILVMKNLEPNQDNYVDSWHRPFESELWLTYMGVVGLFVVFVWWLDRKSPKGHYHMLRDTDEDGFTLLDSISFVGGVAFGKDIGPEKTPASTGARVVSLVFSFLALIILNTYCANLMAFLIEDRHVSPISGIYDPKLIAEPPVFNLGALRGSNIEDFFKHNTNSFLRKVHSTNIRKNTIASLKEAVEKLQGRVLQGFVGDYLALRQVAYTDTQCRFSVIEVTSFHSGYGFAFSKASPWKHDITLSVLKNQENGTVQSIKDRWFRKQPCQRKKYRRLLPGDFQGFLTAVVCLAAFSVLALSVEVVMVCCLARFDKYLGPFGRYLTRFLFNVKEGEESEITIQRRRSALIPGWRVVRVAFKQTCCDDEQVDVCTIERQIASVRSGSHCT